jgi:hypothetical protein
MGSKITLILDVLGDGMWHETGDLQQQVKLDEHKMQKVIGFLKEFDFVRISPHKKVRVSRSFQKLMAQTLT